MRVIGLTGSIACGKSTVSAWLARQADCRVIDGDQLSRRLTAPGGAALPEIRRVFGDSVFTESGLLNRRRLGALVFSDDGARRTLDDLMAPLLQELTEQSIQEARAEGVTLCFLDYPLLYEKGYDALCDTVWCVHLPRPLQLQRLMARDGLTEAEALARMDAVLSSEEKAARSPVVIDNSGEVSFTLSLLPPLLEKERAAAAAAPARRRRSEQRKEDAVTEGESPAAEPGGLKADSIPGRTAPAASTQPLSVRAPQSTPEPGPVMERPSAARRKKEKRKAAWALPSWLLVLLCVFGFLNLACLTAQSLMLAYLTRQADLHDAEERAIHANYPLEYRDFIEAAAAEYNLNPAFVSAIIRNESSFQPRAESGVGARGLMQLMPDTAEWIAQKMKFSGYAFERMYDPESNIRFGCWYLRYLSSLFQGDPVCVACAYHAGQGQVIAWLSDARYSADGVTLDLDRLLDGPTKNYAGRVIRTYGIYQALYFTVHLPGVDADNAVQPRPGQ